MKSPLVVSECVCEDGASDLRITELCSVKAGSVLEPGGATFGVAFVWPRGELRVKNAYGLSDLFFYHADGGKEV